MIDDIGFKSDPWQEANNLLYPNKCRTFYPKHERCWVSVEQKTGNLIFFVRADGNLTLDKNKKYKGFITSVENFKEETRLLCILSDVALKDKFSLLAKSVAKDTAGLNGESLILRAAEIIDEWASFFKPSMSGLKDEEYIGIWGELYILNYEILKNYEPKDAIDFWIGSTGPSNNTAKQDFTLNNLALELKTTRSGGSKDIKISSKDQLDKITDKLYLVHLFINESTGDNSYSLKELYDSISDKLISNDASKIDFIKKSNYYLEKANEKQLNNKLGYLGNEIYDVTEGFPCLTNTNIPKGVTKIIYEISSTSIKPFSIKKTISDIIK